tara:strand:+ start:1024 stop:2304 length:1281 start_codon:yes stop_codon:yes gene_type:complete
MAGMTLADALAIVAETAAQDTIKAQNELNYALTMAEMESRASSDYRKDELAAQKLRLDVEKYNLELNKFEDTIRQSDLRRDRENFAANIQDLKETNENLKGIGAGRLVSHLKSLVPNTNWTEDDKTSQNSREKAFKDYSVMFGSNYGSRIYNLVAGYTPDDKQFESLAVQIAREVMESYSNSVSYGTEDGKDLRMPGIVNSFIKAGIIKPFPIEGGKSIGLKFGIIQSLYDSHLNAVNLDREMKEFRNTGDMSFSTKAHEQYKMVDTSNIFGDPIIPKFEEVTDFQQLLIDIKDRGDKRNLLEDEMSQISDEIEQYAPIEPYTTADYLKKWDYDISVADRLTTTPLKDKFSRRRPESVRTQVEKDTELVAQGGNEGTDAALRLSQHVLNMQSHSEIKNELITVEAEIDSLSNLLSEHPDYKDIINK